MLVSVVIPGRNAAKFLGQTILNVLAQTYRPLEVIVVDNGSTDDTALIARQFGEPVRVVREERVGLHHARNAGLAAAQGEFIQFLDADDLLDPSKIAVQVEYLTAHPDVDVVYGQGAYFRESICDADEPITVIRDADDFPTALLANHLLTVHSALVRRRVFDRVEPFDTALPAQEDWDFWWRAARAGCRFEYVPDTMCYYRRHDEQMTRDLSRMTAGLEARLAKVRGLLADRDLTSPERQALLKMHLDLWDWYNELDADNDRRRDAAVAVMDLLRGPEGPIDWWSAQGSELSDVELRHLPQRLIEFALRAEHPSVSCSVMRWLNLSESAIADGRDDDLPVEALELAFHAFFAGRRSALDSDMTAPMIRLAQAIIESRPAEQIENEFPSLAPSARLIRRFHNGLATKVPFAVYGAGLSTWRLFCLAPELGGSVCAIIDDDDALHGTRLFDIPVVSMERVVETPAAAILIPSSQFADDMVHRCRAVTSDRRPVILL
ncbi:MAG: glycosyltransferase [Deltaproteobacteria bacterium]|nr:glycosyltransferase [Deltaproteobacteria bacterium]MCB9479736.1 glycosyltransferase [Deltaproteobacteria bacterium]MCB9487506.1 glycosyltransferase [Deltaproteobacteria bacterium]